MQQIPKNLLEGWEIVVVDDEEDSLEVAEIILLEYGASVYTASDGRQGLRLIKTIEPRFVISDMSMPEMDGWGLLSALKEDAELSEIPVIALTAHAMQGDRERALDVGFNNYLTKPLTVDTFMSDLVKLLVDIPSLVEHLNI